MTTFKGQKVYHSPELTIPDYGHLNSYFMENILAYTNSTLIIADKMPYQLLCSASLKGNIGRINYVGSEMDKKSGEMEWGH